MRRVQLIHWNAAEAEEQADRLRAAGYEVAYDLSPLDLLRQLRRSPPSAVVINLSRLPVQGRDVALAVRHHKSTRRVPLVFVDGQPEKIERVRRHLPDAVYTPWRRIRSSLKRAIAHPPSDPVVPQSLLDGYSGTPLPKKLGIKANSVVLLIGAPEGFATTLGDLPDGVVFRNRAQGRCDMAIWFPKSCRDLERRVKRLGTVAGKGGLWIASPKKSSGVETDLTQAIVRKVGLVAGLVDYKVCAIDATWTGLRFARRKS